VALVAVTMALAVSSGAPAAARQDGVRVTAPPTAVSWPDVPPEGWPTPPPASARSYLLVDADTGQVLAARSPDEPRIVASTVKLLTVLTALASLSPDDEVVVGPAAGIGGAGTSVDPGETWRVGDLLDAVLVRSGNDAAMALAEAAGGGDVGAFVEDMRSMAVDLGLDEATIVEPTGLDDANELSARDLATIARAALADDRIRAAAGRASVDLPDQPPLANRNLLVGSYPNATGLKTGFTEAAGYCLVASARRGERELVAVVLGAREDPARFDEAAALLDLGFEGLDSVTWEPLRARQPGTWADLLPAGTGWAPPGRDVTTRLAGAPEAPRFDVVAGGEVLGRATLEVPAPGMSSTGEALSAALYRGMRQAHVQDAWVDPGGSGTTTGSSG
jgi:D-alanyl-D-alanine carboxypeptidase